MKKTLLFGIVSLSIGLTTSYSQYILLDNYFNLSGHSLPVVYGNNMPANGVSGALGAPGAGLNSAWTIGFYWAAGTTGLSQGPGWDIPHASLTLATGIGSTAQVAGDSVFGEPGYYSSIPRWNSGSTLNTTLTLEIVVYDSADGSYASAHYRMHSAAFSMPTVNAISPTPSCTGDYMPGVLFMIPEPTTLALGGLGLASLLFLRRKPA